MSETKNPVVKRLIDPETEDRRVWTAKRQGTNPRATQSTSVLFCEFCNAPITEKELIIDRDARRACVTCGKK